MRRFENKDAEYVAWLEHNQAGFVLNVGSAMLHTAQCGYISWPLGGGSHTAAPKACSLEREELERWGREAGLSIIPCSKCKT